MKNQDSAILKWQKILVEIMTVWIVMVASSIFSRTEPNIVGFFIWLGIAIGIYAMVRIYFKHQLKYIYLLFLAFPLAFFGVLLGFTLIQSAALSGIIAWRMVKHEKDPDSETETFFYRHFCFSCIYNLYDSTLW
ncbi:hypothetical protein [Piscibacillus salipiscarius]|uniref:hypothetical protein n=1 Tax=Piscibacillus salipiscarius TaxID=299480 RepID=UPI0006D1890A|nr:hypothetical protein [Piscibacillus salipiscarius]